MAKYFSGIVMNKDKCNISIIDDNLNVIFMDNLEVGKLIDLLKRKSVTVISLDFPLALYLKHSNSISNKAPETLSFRKRSFDNMLGSKNLLTYNDRFSISRECLNTIMDLSRQLDKLGFAVRKIGETEKSIIESYPDTSFTILGCTNISSIREDESLKRKIDALRSRGMRIKDFLKKGRCDSSTEINSLCQAYMAYLYHAGETTSLGALEEGILVLPSKGIQGKLRVMREFPREKTIPDRNENKSARDIIKPVSPAGPISKVKLNAKVIAEYCGAQYLYTNSDGVIRVNELRPIKSYRPFTEIYEINHIKLVQVTIGTTDGLRRVKANLIPNGENQNSFRAAEEEDKKKLDSFWGNHGDRRGYIIKFNKVEVIKA